MKVTVFTGNQPRHLALVRRLAQRVQSVHAVLECTTLFPGQVPDFYRKSDVMREYFSLVQSAERKLFGEATFSLPNVRTFSMRGGDLNLTAREQIAEALESDVYVVFGASYIKGWLADFLVLKNAINIHMGVSPYYRGSSCNFWALFDERPELVGATIHLLSKGLDSGPMLYHALPKFTDDDPFLFTMKAVEAAQRSLIDRMIDGNIFDLEPIPQDRSVEIRYTRNADFTDETAETFLRRNIDPQRIGELLRSANKPDLLRPFFA
jgi:folate-dependent phosphoribosylglycinamide formyltransferase PurN